MTTSVPAADRSGPASDERRLDAYAASAAHSLGTGVSIASGYATLLRERHGAALGADGRATLAGLEGGLARVRLFMEDLLQLAALEALPLERAPVELGPVATAAVHELEGLLAEAGVEVAVGRLPALAGDGPMLGRLLHHLIRAAIAAIAPGPGRIAISGAREGESARIEVTDTGPPLDRGAAARPFETFAPPRGSGPATGAGVSMAIARRIVERHGGSIRARATEDTGGCTILVLLPADHA